MRVTLLLFPRSANGFPVVVFSTFVTCGTISGAVGLWFERMHTTTVVAFLLSLVPARLFGSTLGYVSFLLQGFQLIRSCLMAAGNINSSIQ